MRDGSQLREMVDRNETKVNSILSKSILIFLIVCPVLFLINFAGITDFSMKELGEISAVFIVFSIVPYIICSRMYDEKASRMILLTSIEIMLCVIAFNPIMNISMFYILVPVISIVYMKRSIFFKVASYCFFAMLVMEAVRLFDEFRLNPDLGAASLFQQQYERLISLVFGYVIIMVAIYLIFGWIQDFVKQFSSVEKEKDDEQTKTVAVITTEEDTVYNVKGLFLSVNQTVQGLIRGKDKSLVVNVDYDLPAELKGKPEQLKLAIVNMLSDFLQFTEQGTVTLSVTFEKGITPRKGQNLTVICRVLCSEDLTDRMREGITMGFALAKNIITGMGGIVLDKTFGNAVRQTCYTVSFMQEVADEQTLMMVKQKNRDDQKALIRNSREKELNVAGGRSVKAMVVDDSRENLRLVKAILKSFGITAECVSTGQEAIERLHSKGYDFVLIDHMMPGKSGIQTAKEIRQIDEPYYELLPLMVMSSNVTEESRQIFSSCGFSEIISKPIKEEELRLAISRIYLQ